MPRKRLPYSDDPQVYDIRDAVEDALSDTSRVADALRRMYDDCDEMSYAFAQLIGCGPEAGKIGQRLRDTMAKRWEAYNDEEENG